MDEYLLFAGRMTMPRLDAIQKTLLQPGDLVIVYLFSENVGAALVLVGPS